MRKVLIATPCYTGLVRAQYLTSLLVSLGAAQGCGIALSHDMSVGNSSIALARNACVANALAGGFDDLVFIDDDMSWDPRDLIRLLSYDVPLVGAAGRVKKPEPMFCLETFDGLLPAVGVSGLVEAKAIGTGFLRLRRDCLHRMARAFADTAYSMRGVDGAAAKNLFMLFETASGRSEDYRFCDRWREIGGKVLVDPEIRLSHFGTADYAGALSDILTYPPADGETNDQFRRLSPDPHH